MNRTEHSTPLVYSSDTQPSGGRGNGLLGKMFRKGPPKQPKLNPVGISSKDFFSNGPYSAPAPAPGDHVASRRSTKLARKLSALSPALVQNAAPGSFSDGDGDGDSESGEQARPHMPSGHDDARRRRPSMLRLDAASPADDEKTSGRKRRGSLWRAKLGFTNVRRPETRRQRHQSFDSNVIDITAHPRIFAESPLVSLPAAAPTSAIARSSSQLPVDSLLGATPHSATPTAGLAAIDRDFLLTIQRNSALEARRQRRRETRRSTLSFLPPIATDPVRRTAGCVLHAPLLSDAPEGLSSATLPPNPPLTPSEPHPAGSSKSARSSTDGALPPPKLVLSELAQATVKDSIARAALASSSSDLPVSPAASAPRSLPARARHEDSDHVVPPVPPLPHYLASHSCVPRPETASGRESPRISPNPRRVRASASIYPAAPRLGDRPPATSLARTLLSTPPALDLASSLRADHSWDAQTSQLQHYRVSPASARPAPAADPHNLFPHSTDQDTAPAQATIIRKFSHPEAQLLHTPSAPLSPVHTPDVLSKSATNLNIRTSVDKSVPASKYGFGRLFSSSPPSRRINQPPRLPTSPTSAPLPPSPPSPSPSLSPHHHHQQQQQPLSPAVSTLVGDPSARRRIRDQLASSRAFDRLLAEDDEFTMAISLTPTVAGTPAAAPGRK